jgi:hypothetical protein
MEYEPPTQPVLRGHRKNSVRAVDKSSNTSGRHFKAGIVSVEDSSICKDFGYRRSPRRTRTMVFLLEAVSFCKALRDTFCKRSRKSRCAVPRRHRCFDTDRPLDWNPTVPAVKWLALDSAISNPRHTANRHWRLYTISYGLNHRYIHRGVQRRSSMPRLASHLWAGVEGSMRKCISSHQSFLP